MKPLTVLSLFDGISCGRVALERAKIPVEKYYASEIDKYAIKITMKNYPDTIQLGDVTKIDFEPFIGKIDLLIGGSPCQDLSNYKYDRGDVKGLEGSKSSLFYYYVKALRTIKPKYFMLENVGTMESKWVGVISRELGCCPIRIQSSLVSAAERDRLYWTNIGPQKHNLFGLPIVNIPQPADKKLVLKDIVETENIPEKHWLDRYTFTLHNENDKVIATINLNGHRQAKEVYNLNNKCNTLLCDGSGGNLVKKIYQNGRVRTLMPIEYERLQNLPDNYTDCVSDSRRYSAIGNGWTVDVIAHIFSFIKC